MKLFELKKSGVRTGLTFSSKAEAKKERDACNGGTPSELIKANKPVTYTVGRGAEHRHETK